MQAEPLSEQRINIVRRQDAIADEREALVHHGSKDPV
jgi:hypothetical protein